MCDSVFVINDVIEYMRQRDCDHVIIILNIFISLSLFVYGVLT